MTGDSTPTSSSFIKGITVCLVTKDFPPGFFSGWKEWHERGKFLSSQETSSCQNYKRLLVRTRCHNLSNFTLRLTKQRLSTHSEMVSLKEVATAITLITACVLATHTSLGIFPRVYLFNLPVSFIPPLLLLNQIPSLSFCSASWLLSKLHEIQDSLQDHSGILSPDCDGDLSDQRHHVRPVFVFGTLIISETVYASLCFIFFSCVVFTQLWGKLAPILLWNGWWHTYND